MKATGYDGLSSRAVTEPELREFLVRCFEIADHELPSAAFWTRGEVSGHFAMSFSVGIEGRLAERVGRHEFARRFAAHFDAFVLYGDTEPPGQWTVVLPDGSSLRAAMEEDGDHFELYAASAPIPGLPDLRPL